MRQEGWILAMRDNMIIYWNSFDNVSSVVRQPFQLTPMAPLGLIKSRSNDR
jgi:hypothetical protein